MDTVLYLTGQNIDVFNLSSVFYTDICYHFISDIDKDVALKDRILIYFPNITLCEDGCETIGVNISTLKAICECIFNNFKDTNILSNNIIYQSQIGQIEEYISNTNIEIIKCYKDIFKYKFFIKCTGGFIILAIILIQIIVTINYCLNGLFNIRKYIFSITNKYLNYLLSQKNTISLPNNNSLSVNGYKLLKKNGPPKKKYKMNENNNLNESGRNRRIKRRKKKGKTAINKNSHFSIMNSRNKSKDIINNNPLNFSSKIINIPQYDNILILSCNSKNSIDDKNKFRSINSKKKLRTYKKSNKKINFGNSSNLSKDIINKYKLFDEYYLKNDLFINIKYDININIEEYLETEIDDMDYDDAVRRDKRKICNYFCDKLKANQILLNIFIYKEPIKPRALKILLFLIQTDLYFFVNGLFFNEEYISQIFHLEEDTFYECFKRFLGNFFYAALVGVIVNYIIDFFFIDEKKIKGIMKREKDNIIILKYEIVQITKNIKQRYIFFIIISFIITIFTWYHISCFNNVYPHMKREWLIFSIIIIILMQILSIIACLLESIIRFISFKCKSEKIYKISLLFS